MSEADAFPDVAADTLADRWADVFAAAAKDWLDDRRRTRGMREPTPHKPENEAGADLDIDPDLALLLQGLAERLLKAANVDRDAIVRSLAACFPTASGWQAGQAPRNGVVPAESIQAEVAVFLDRWRYSPREREDLNGIGGQSATPAPSDDGPLVDPLCLARLVESHHSRRHRSGAYYTPAVVVTGMCRLALAHSLGEDAFPPEAWLAWRNGGGESPSAAIARRAWSTLHGLRAIDPACGGGEFLIRLGFEAAAWAEGLRVVVGAEAGLRPPRRFLGELLYGVDVDPWAVGVTRLRLALAAGLAAVDGDGEAANFDAARWSRHVIVGDALAGPVFQAAGDPSSQPSRTAADSLDDEHGGGVASVDWSACFPDIFGRSPPGFDIVLANPPYVRQEFIEPRFKARLRRRYQRGVGGASDLLCYFYVRGLELLRPGGMHVFIGSNGWLDTRYGAALRELLASEASLAALIETPRQRQFASAEINTLITVLRRRLPTPQSRTQLIERLSSNDELRNQPDELATMSWTSDGLAPDVRARSVPQAELLASAPSGWGARLLRRPGIQQVLLERGRELLAPLGDWADVSPGCYAGVNDFFYLSEEQARARGIEPEYLRPLVRSPRQVQRLCLDEGRLLHESARDDAHRDDAPSDDAPHNDDLAGWLIFACPHSREELQRRGARGALEYIAWGERQTTRRRQKTAAGVPWPQVSSVARRKPGWWALPPRQLRAAQNFLLYVVGQRFLAPWSQRPWISDRCFHRLTTADEHRLPLAAALNSTLTMLLISTSGRGNLGQGAFKFEALDAKALPIVPPSQLAASSGWQAPLQSLGRRVVLPIEEELSQPDRRRLDEPLFDALRLTPGERDGVYEAVAELVTSRLERARSLDRRDSRY